MKKKLLFMVCFSFINQTPLLSTELRLIQKGLSQFPMSLAFKNNATQLLLSNNDIKEIPKEINVLKNLKGLCLCSNQITSIPEEICELNNLEFLCLEHNPLETIPLCVTSMTCEIILTFDNSGYKNELFARLLLRKSGLTSLVQENKKIIFIKDGLFDQEFKNQHGLLCKTIEEKAKVITAQSKRKSSCNRIVTTSKINFDDD